KLAGTKWKLEGIVNEQTGEMQILVPTDCEECYTLEFDTDTTACGKSVMSTVYININYLEGYSLTFENEPYNGNDYRAALSYMNGRYIIEESQLKLYFEEVNVSYYLFFLKNYHNENEKIFHNWYCITFSDM
ncbi:MAG: hypothetical protein LBR36_04750, partial [Bacteroidales bacterium]|nr:hypothetical protein [Bacteroidales bacterium]